MKKGEMAQLKNEMVVKEMDTHLQKMGEFGDLFDATPIDKNDFLIPKLLLMQSVSAAVQEERARAGEIRESIDNKKITEKEGSVEIIPFGVYKTWITLSKLGSEFISQEPLTAANCAKPREQIVGGIEILNYETLNYYCILPSEVALGMFMPYVVSFRSTSYMAGKTLETHRARLQEFGLPLPFKTFNLGSSPRKNDKGNYYVFTISESRSSTEEELSAVKHWFGLIQSGKAKVDDSDLEPVNVTRSDKVEDEDEY